jgi:hypothetical protein
MSASTLPAAYHLDIRTKLALVLVFVSLISMGLISLFAYQTSSQLLRDSSTRQLDALAESKANDLNKVHQGWRDKTRLIRNSVELRPGLEEFIVDHDDEAHQSLVSLLARTALGVEGVRRVTIVNKRLQEVCSVGKAQVFSSITLPQGDREISYQGTHLSETKGILVAMTTPLQIDGVQVGGLEVVFDATDLQEVVGNRTGLGETGEVIVVTKSPNDQPLLLNSLRHEADLVGPGQITNQLLTSSLRRVLDGESGIYINNVTDYRGEQVWVATRVLAELGWGLIVKVDALEEGEKAESLRDSIIDIALALSAFAIIGGTLLGFYLARPIHDLALIVERIRHGEQDLRAEVSGDDEIAYLGESVNALIDYMQENYPEANLDIVGHNDANKSGGDQRND